MKETKKKTHKKPPKNKSSNHLGEEYSPKKKKKNKVPGAEMLTSLRYMKKSARSFTLICKMNQSVFC